MRWNVLLIFFLATGSISWRTKQHNPISLNTFISIPKDLQGTGETFYLSAKDKKKGKFICITDYEIALIYIDHKPLRLKAKNVANSSKNKQIFTDGRYSLIIIEGPLKQFGNEDYTMKGTLTLKYNSRIVWEKSVIGEGGD